MSLPRWMVVGLVVAFSPVTAHALGVELEGGGGVSGSTARTPPQAFVHGGLGLLFGERDQLEVHLQARYPPWAAPFVAGTFRGHLRFGPASGPWFNLGLGGGAGLGVEGPSVVLLAEASPAFEVRIAPRTHLLVGATLTAGPLFFAWPQDLVVGSWRYTWTASVFVGVAFGSNLH